MEDYRLLLEIVEYDQIKEIQKKLNQWITTEILLKYTVKSIYGGKLLFEIMLKK